MLQENYIDNVDINSIDSRRREVSNINLPPINPTLK